jgi:serpin B/serpin B11/12
MGQASSQEVYLPADNVHQSNNILARKLFDVVEKEHVFSPLSISYIISLLHLASVENTDTQITSVMMRKNTLEDLQSLSKTFNSGIIKLANAVLVNKKFQIKSGYLEMVKELTLVSEKDFSDSESIAKEANHFISEKTNGMIKNVLSPNMIDLDTVMILINTLYFKAPWKSPFQERLTSEEKFNNNILVSMMNNTGYNSYYEDLTVQRVELMYKDTDYCMGFILPKSDVSLDKCTSYLGDGNFESKYVKLFIPKFTQRKRMDLIPYMKKLGMTDLFDSTSRLDNMVSSDAYVSVLIHEAVVIVNETGTEASAVTVAVCQSKGIRRNPEPIIFRADHSFIYYIKHIPTKTLLFVGDYHGN